MNKLRITKVAIAGGRQGIKYLGGRIRSPIGAVLLGCVLIASVAGTASLSARAIAHLRQANSAGSLNLPQSPEVTALAAPHTNFARQTIAVDPLFQAYYASTAGAIRLGAAATPAIPVVGGWLQFFTAGALLYSTGRSPVISTRQITQDGDSDDVSAQNPLSSAILQASHTADSTVLPLPLLTLLTQAGSEAQIGGMSNLTYVGLRAAIMSSRPVPAPAWYLPSNPVKGGNAFVPVVVAHGKALGYLVPLSFWTMMTESANAPDGWQADYGLPLTAALPATTSVGGAKHQLLVQVFAHAALVVDTTAASATAYPLATGVDYLRTFGPPAVLVAAGTPAWVAGNTPIYQGPNSAGTVVAQLGSGYLLLTADARWVQGDLWYQVAWSSVRGRFTGWIPASAMTFTAIGTEPANADFDVLDPSLASYIARLGSLVGVVVYDQTRDVYYASNPNDMFITGSSVKVPIMLALLAQTEAQGREPDGNEMSLLTTMIENSDNDSAQALYEEIGDAPGLATAMRQFGIAGLSPSPGTWGWSSITPAAMVQLLSLVQDGRTLTASDRALALNLMENIESDQQFGAGDTAPPGAVVAMKNGWVTGPDGLWDINTSAIISRGGETFIISVYTADDDSFQDGVDIVEHICAAVSAVLM